MLPPHRGHRSKAAAAVWLPSSGGLGQGDRRCRRQQRPAECQLVSPVPVGEKAVMADPVEAVRQGVQQEAADEFLGVEGHDLLLAAMTIVAPAEGHFGIGDADQAGIGDSDPMGVAAEIGQHLLRPAEGSLGIDDPRDAAQACDPAGKGSGVCEPGKIAEEAEFAPLERALQVLDKPPPEQPGEHADRQAIQRVPSSDSPPPGTMQWMCG